MKRNRDYMKALSFVRRAFSNSFHYFALSVLLGIVYVLVAEPAKAGNLHVQSVVLIIGIFALLHLLAIFAVLPYIVSIIVPHGQTVLTAVITSCIFANLFATSLRLMILPHQAQNFFDFLELFFAIFLTSNLICLPGWLLAYISNFPKIIDELKLAGYGGSLSNENKSGTGVDELQKMLPVEKRGKILFLRASGVYTEVNTTTGTHLLRIGLGEAELLSLESGMRVHKSYWVPRDQFRRVIYNNGNPQLLLVTGDIIPLSRRFVIAVSEAIRGM